MIIQIAGTTICDGADRSANKSAGPSGLTIVGSVEMQPGKYIRATSAEYFNRGNQTNQVSFSISRAHSSVAAAEAWMLMHTVTVPRAGTVTFNLGSTSYRLLNAVLNIPKIEQVGVSVMVDYAITGGLMELAS